MREGRIKRKNGGLVLILIVLILIIAGLSFGILWLSGVFSGEEPEPVVSEPTITTTPDLGNASEMSNTMIRVLNGSSNSEDYREFESYLKENLKDESEPSWSKATAYYSLAYMKYIDGNEDEALDLINEGLALEDVPDNYKYPLLSLAQNVYSKKGDAEKEMRVIEEMLNLSDDTKLYWQDWNVVKQDLMEKLEGLKASMGGE